MSLTSHLNAVVSSSNMETLWDMHCQKLDGYGFDRIIYGFSRSVTDVSPGAPDDMVLLTNHDKAYTDVFIREGLFHNAPMVRWGMNNFGTSSWSVVKDWVEQGKLSHDEIKVLEFNKEHNVTAGYSQSMHSAQSRSRGGFALTAKKGFSQFDVDAIWGKYGDEIALINSVTHLKLLTLPYNDSYQLTRRQREVLEWVGDGKTVADTAMIMGLTPATVEKHLRLARDNLQVETTAQAILKASFLNQIFILDI